MANWNCLPLLPLKCILEYLNQSDAFAAMSTCRHWRTAILLYEGLKETLKLKVKNPEQCLLLSRVFRRHARKLQIYLDSSSNELEWFMDHIIMQLYDVKQIEEILIIGTSCIDTNECRPELEIKRFPIESLLLSNIQRVKRFALLGVQYMDDAKILKKNDVPDNLWSTPLQYNDKPSQDYVIFNTKLFSQMNMTFIVLCNIQHIITDYKMLNTESLITLSFLTTFRFLTLNICTKNCDMEPIDWNILYPHYEDRLSVGVNIVSLPLEKFQVLMDNYLTESLPLTSLKVLFCNVLYPPLISHIVELYKFSLYEFVWADAPLDRQDVHQYPVQFEYSNANIQPFILLCWQCELLQTLVIHGYWIWYYDVIGFGRLRLLKRLEVSSITCQSPINTPGDTIRRVLTTDTQVPLQDDYCNKIKQFCTSWLYQSWDELHAGLQGNSTSEKRIDYLVSESTKPFQLNNIEY